MNANNTQKIIDEISRHMHPEWNQDEKIRYVYIALGKLINKNVNFFYSIGNKLEDKNLTFEEIKSIYDDDNTDSMSIICKSAAELLKVVFDSLGIEAKLIQTTDYSTYTDKNSKQNLDIYHWFVSVKGENNRNYFLTIIPDLVNIQFGMSTSHFANRIEYYKDYNGIKLPVYKGKEIDCYTMSDEEIEKLDEKIGYIHPYYTKDKKGNDYKRAEYNNIFLDYLRDIISRKNDYINDLGLDTEFYKDALNFIVKDGLKVEDYLNNGEIKIEELIPWFDYLEMQIMREIPFSSAKYKDSIGKLNGLKEAIKEKSAKKYRRRINLLANNFIDKEYLRDEDGFCSSEYIIHKLETIFPLMFCCNEELLPPLTNKFNGLSEQLDFIDLFFDNAFYELKDKNANKGITINPKYSLIRNRIQRYVILDKKTNTFSIIFSIDNSNVYFYFNPNSGEFYRVRNFLNLISGEYIIVSDELRNRIRTIEKIENIEEKRER